MSKLSYNDEWENGGDGWNENFGDDLAEEANYAPENSSEGNNPDYSQSQVEALPSEVEPPSDGGPLEGDIQEQLTHSQSDQVEMVEVDTAEAVHEVQDDPVEEEQVPEEEPASSSEIQAPSKLTTFPTEIAAALPVAEESQTTEVPPPPPPAPRAPVRSEVAVSGHVAKATFPSSHVAKVPLVSSATLRTAVTGTSAISSEQTGQRKLVLPQGQIKYRQPMDYAAVLANAAKATARVNQARAAAAKPQPTAVPTVSNTSSNIITHTSVSTAAVVVTQRPFATNKLNPNLMTYPPPQANKTPTSAGVARQPEHPNQRQQRPAEKPASVPPQFQQQHQQKQHIPAYPQPAQPVSTYPSVTRSATVPDIIEAQQQQQQPPQQQQMHQSYYGQPGTNGEGYSSEHEGHSRRSHGKNSEERRSRRKHRRDRASNQFVSPAVDPYQTYGGMLENPQSYQDYYNQWYMQQARMQGYYSGATTPSEYGDGGSEYGEGSRSRPSSRMSLQGAYSSPQVADGYGGYSGQQYPAGYDPAAWWYWYYMQQQEIHRQQLASQRPSTPKKFAYPHCRATFSASGFLVTVMPGRNAYAETGIGSAATKVNIIRTCDIVSSALPEVREYTEFPGPLVPNESHKVDIINFAQRMSQQAMASDYIDRDSVNLLWRFIELLVRQNGTYYGADVSQLLTEALPELPEQLIEPADQVVIAPTGSIQELRKLLLHGRKREAVDFAMNHNLWAHAMFISHSISEQFFLTVRNRFLAASAAPGDPMATFYQLATLSSPVISRQAVLSDMYSWRQHLAVILSNSAVHHQFQRQLLLSLGDTLRAQGRLYAAQLCYLMAGDQFSAFPPNSGGYASVVRMVLLGTEPNTDFLQLTKPYFCQLTEIYEYCTRLANPRAILPGFQVFKAFYCLCLAEFGFVHEAFRYLLSLVECLQIGFLTSPNFPNNFPRICFKWLSDLYTALHKYEPAVDYTTVEWIFRAAEGKPIEPPPLEYAAQVQNPPSFGSTGSEMFRPLNQTPGPLSNSLQGSDYNRFDHSRQSSHSVQSTNQVMPQQIILPQQSPIPPSLPQQVQFKPQQPEPSPPAVTSQAANPVEPPRPFDSSRRFEKSVSHRSDGASDSDLPFGSSNFSMTSITNNLADVRETAKQFNQPRKSSDAYQPDEPPIQKAPPPNIHEQPPAPTYVSPLSTWQPGVPVPNSLDHNSVSPQPPRQDAFHPGSNNRDALPTPPPHDDLSQKNDSSKNTPGLFGNLRDRLFGGSNSGAKGPSRMVLPDDKNPTMIFDKARNKWIDTSKGDGEDEVEDIPPPPPPPMMAPEMAPMSAPSMHARPRGRYVDVLKPPSATTQIAANGPLLRQAFPAQGQPQKFFVPQPVPDST